MSQKKIDSEKILTGIFGQTGPESQKVDESRVTNLLSDRDPKKKVRRKWTDCFQFLTGRGKREFGALDVGNDSIKYVLLAKDKKRLYLKDLRIEKIVLSSDKETPADKEKETLNRLVKIASFCKSKTKVGIALQDPALYMEALQVSAASEDICRDLIQKELAEKHLIDLKTNFFDYTELSATTERGRNDVFVVAAPKEMVYHQYEIVQSAGFRVKTIETNMLATLESLKRVMRWTPNERSLILDIGAKYTSLSFMNGDRIALGRIIPIAGRDFTKAVEDELQCSFERAEQFKIKHGLKEPRLTEDTPANKRGTEAVRVSQAIYEEVDRLLMEVGRSFRFAFSKEADPEEAPIHSIYLLGGSSQMINLKNYIGDELGAPVREVNLWDGLVVDRHRLDDDYLKEMNSLAAVSLGLALRVREWKRSPAADMV